MSPVDDSFLWCLHILAYLLAGTSTHGDVQKLLDRHVFFRPRFQSFQTGLARSVLCPVVHDRRVRFYVRHESSINPALETTRQRFMSHLEASTLRFSSCVFQGCSQQGEARNWMAVQLRLSRLAVPSALREQLTQLACRPILHASVSARTASSTPDGSNHEPELCCLSVVAFLAILMYR